MSFALTHPHILFLSTTILCVFSQIPECMLDKDGTELVLDACPQLTSLALILYHHSYTTTIPLITSLALDLPSLECLSLRGVSRRATMSSCESSQPLETLRLTCPNLVDLRTKDCPRLSLPPTLMAQLTHFSGEVSFFFVIMGIHGSTTRCDCDP